MGVSAHQLTDAAHPRMRQAWNVHGPRDVDDPIGRRADVHVHDLDRGVDGRSWLGAEPSDEVRLAGPTGLEPAAGSTVPNCGYKYSATKHL